MPAFFAYVTVGAVLALLLKGEHDQAQFFGQAVTSMLYLNNYYRLYHEDAGSWLGHVWSLSLEEQFYLVWPVCLRLLCRVAALRARLPAVLVLGAIAVIGWRLALLALGASEARLYYGIDTRADALLLGCALAAWRHEGYPGWPGLARWRPVLGASALLALAALTSVREGEIVLHGLEFTLLAVLAGTVVYSADGPETTWTRLLGARPLAALGRVSYGFYLWHFPVAAVLGGRLPAPIAVVLAGIVSYALAALSYRMVDAPMQRRRPASATTVPSDVEGAGTAWVARDTPVQEAGA